MLAHVAVAVAGELDDPPRRDGAGRELLVVDGARVRDVERVPAGVGQAPAEVDLVGVDEELRVEAADLARRPRGGRASPPTAPSRPGAPRSPRLCTTSALVQEQRRQQRGAGRREAPRRRLLLAVGADEHRPGRAGALVGVERGVQGDGRAGLELGVLVEQQAEAPARALQQRGVVGALARAARGSAITSVVDRVRARHLGRPVLGGVVEHQHLGLEVDRRALARDRVQAVAQQAALLGVDDAEGELDGHGGLHLAASNGADRCVVPDAVSRTVTRGRVLRSRRGQGWTPRRIHRIGRQLMKRTWWAALGAAAALGRAGAPRAADNSVIVKYKAGRRRSPRRRPRPGRASGASSARSGQRRAGRPGQRATRRRPRRRSAARRRSSTPSPNVELHALGDPNDARFGELYGLNNANDADMDAPEGWDLGRLGEHPGDATVGSSTPASTRTTRTSSGKTVACAQVAMLFSNRVTRGLLHRRQRPRHARRGHDRGQGQQRRRRRGRLLQLATSRSARRSTRSAPARPPASRTASPTSPARA